MMKQRNANCSFCRKSYTDVGPLVEGPGEIYICGECIKLCWNIVRQEQQRRHPPKPLDEIELHQKLDRLMSGQEEAKRALTLVLGPREGHLLILLTGPSPAAKLLLSRAVAHLLEVPFAKGNASDLLSSHESTAGLPPLLFSLLKESDFDLDLAQRGLVYVEGAESPACQHAILEFCHTDNFEPHARIPFDPAGILLVCGATLPGSEPVGEALERAGALPEWRERLSAVAYVDPLDEATSARMVMVIDVAKALN
jgi:hypothetical protein